MTVTTEDLAVKLDRGFEENSRRWEENSRWQKGITDRLSPLETYKSASERRDQQEDWAADWLTKHPPAPPPPPGITFRQMAAAGSFLTVLLAVAGAAVKAFL